MATHDERLEDAAKKVCPMLQMNNKGSRPTLCITAECAWFVDGVCECALTAIPGELVGIRDAIFN